MDKSKTDSVEVDRRFAIIEDWVIRSDVSDRAFRLYSLLVRYADKDTHKAFPSYQLLAERLRCSKKSVQRATDELVEKKMLKKKYRYNSSIVYTVVTRKPRGVDTGDQGGGHQSPGGWTGVTTGVDTGVHLTRPTKLDQPNDKDIAQEFDQFWSQYPRKVGKGQARKAFTAALKKTSLQEIMTGLGKYAAQVESESIEFVAHPSTWLNGERWSDDYDSEVSKRGNRKKARPNYADGLELVAKYQRMEAKEIGQG